MTDQSDDPTVEIGGRTFSVPEFSGWANRKVSPALMQAAKLANELADGDNYSKLLDTVYMCLTVQTKDGKKDGPKVNDISAEEFDNLRINSLHIAEKVLPLLLTQAGLKRSEVAGPKRQKPL